MLRTELNKTSNSLTLTLLGRLSGTDAEFVTTLVVQNYEPANDFIVDLTDVTAIDRKGETTLALLGRMGARFIAVDPYVLHVCERLGLSTTKPRGNEDARPADCQ